MANEAIEIIRAEHRSLAAVLDALNYLIDEIREGRMQPDFRLYWAMIHYIEAFPEKLHHPKEDAYLFRKLRARTSEFDATLDELERQHVLGHAHVEELEQSIAGYETDPAGGFARFAAAVQAFATAQTEHIALEFKVIIPAARVHLTEGDWREIGAAFAGNSDPRFSVDNDEEFRQLFARIMNLAPEPVIGHADRG